MIKYIHEGFFHKRDGTLTALQQKVRQTNLPARNLPFQKIEDSPVDTVTFILPPIQFLYILLCGKNVPVYRPGHFTAFRR